MARRAVGATGNAAVDEAIANLMRTLNDITFDQAEEALLALRDAVKGTQGARRRWLAD